MSLKQKITEDMKAAMRAGNAKRRDTIRLLQAAIKQREVDERIDVDDAPALAQEYEANPIPKLVYFRNGEPVDVVERIPEGAYKAVFETKLAALVSDGAPVE